MALSTEGKSAIGMSTQEKWREINRIVRKNSTLIVLLLFWSALSVVSPNFLTQGNFLNILLQASNLAIISWGMTLVILLGEIDIAVGSVEALAGSVAAVLMVIYKMPTSVGILGAIVAGLLAGAFTGFLVARFRIPSMIVTLGMASIARGLALILTNGTAVYDLPPFFQFIGQGKVGIIPFPVIIALVLFFVTFAILRFTRFGTNIYATGSNEEAARLSGISLARVRVAVMTISGVCAAIAGMILASRLNSGNGTVGTNDNMDAIAAVVIGGTSLTGGVGTVTGTLIGVLLVASIRNGLNLMAVSAFWQQVAIGGLILISVVMDYLTKRRNKS